MVRYGRGVAAALLALLMMAAAACARAPLGYGVVLWGAGGELPAATAVQVMEESSIEDRYLVRGAAPRRGEEPVPVERWRVRRAPDSAAAAAFAARYAPFAASYGYSARNGLPVRLEESATADIVYKLRTGEVVKVLARSAQPAQVGVYENHWYEVLTETGVTGFTFGEFLPVFEARGDPYAVAARLLTEDATLERLLATVWRPADFHAMVVTGRYDLSRLRPEYGLFPDPAAQVFRLVTAAGTREFPYATIDRVGDGRYVLQPGDAAGRLRLTVQSATRLAVSYTTGARLDTRVFVDLQRDVAELVAAERARRDERYAGLLARGSRLRSSGYGTIELEAARGFRWRGFEALVPGLLPAGLPGTGRVDFRYAPGPELADRYDAVVSFLFDPEGQSSVAPRPAATPPAPAAGAPAAAGPAAPPGAEPAAPPGPAAEPAPPAAEPAALPEPAAVPATPPAPPAAPATQAAPPAEDAPPAGGPAAAGQSDPGALPAPPEAPPIEPAAELILLAEYDGAGIRLTPAEPDLLTRQVTEVSRTPVVMYFAFAAAAAPAVSTTGDG